MFRQIVVVALFAACLAGPAEAAAKGKIVGYLALSEGEVSLRHVGEDARPPGPAEAVFEGDLVVTGADGRAKVLFLDDSVVTLGANTEIALRRYAVDVAANERKSLLELAKGTLRVLVSRVFSSQRSFFQVETRTAVAGVRGTEFVAQAENAECGFTTLDGELSVWRADQKEADGVPVKSGHGALAKLADAAPLSVASVSSATLDLLRAQTTVGARPHAVAMKVERFSAAELLTDLGASGTAADGFAQSNVGREGTSGGAVGGAPGGQADDGAARGDFGFNAGGDMLDGDGGVEITDGDPTREPTPDPGTDVGPPGLDGGRLRVNIRLVRSGSAGR